MSEVPELDLVVFLFCCSSVGGILKGVFVPSPRTGVLTVIAFRRWVVKAILGVSLFVVFELFEL